MNPKNPTPRAAARACGPRPPRSAPLAGLAVALACLLAGPSRADDFNFHTPDRVIHGRERPVVTFTPPMDLSQLELRLIRGDGKGIQVKHGPARAGVPVSFEFDQDVGRQHYEGSIVFKIDGSEYEMPLAFDTVVGKPPVLTVALDKLDTTAQTLVLTSSQPAGEAQVKVIGEGGAVLFEGTQTFAGERPGTPLTLRWGPATGTVLRIDVSVADPSGFPGAVAVFPWSYAVPHEEIVFESGKADVLPSEADKLDATWSEITRVVRRYGDIVQMDLYVAGYTDTVGDSASNDALSLARARAIARELRARGFTGTLYCQGFGERALAVPTADNVDEQANRRAMYVLSANPPPRSADFPTERWTPLK